MSLRFKRGRHFIQTAFILLFALGLTTALLTGCGGKSGTAESAPTEEPAGAAPAGEPATTAEKGGTASAAAHVDQPSVTSIAVFIPGVIAGSPLYQMLAEGVEEAAAGYAGTAVKIVEGGFNQAEWQDRVTELAATKAYDLIVSSNPALPEICEKVSRAFPEQKFLLLDGKLEGNPSIYTFRYNQFEQAFLAGHMAGLVTTSDMPGANPDLKIGLIAGQEYPDMNMAIRPGFLAGARRVHEGIDLDFRVVGNWYDATKAQELANSMIKAGVDVILPISGGANQGVIKAAEESGIYLHWFDISGYENAPGRVIGSTALLQRKAAYEKTLAAMEGRLPFGHAETVGIADGWIEFIDDDPLYIEHVPENLRRLQSELFQELRSGALKLEPAE
jgi:simple sugar transport system substrate-binding protein